MDIFPAPAGSGLSHLQARPLRLAFAPVTGEARRRAVELLYGRPKAPPGGFPNRHARRRAARLGGGPAPVVAQDP